MSHPGLVFARSARTPAERSQYYRWLETGALMAVTRGASCIGDVWRAADADERHRILVHAAFELSDQSFAVSHASAAALWRMPWLGSWPDRAQGSFDGHPGRSSRSLLARIGPDEGVVTIDGLPVVPLERCVAQVASTHGLTAAVVVADAALAGRRTDDQEMGPALRSRMLVELDSVALHHGRSKARSAIDFADGDAGSPAESTSRVSILRAGLAAPILQWEFEGPNGEGWATDFGWLDERIAGECDGEGKYLSRGASGEAAAREVIKEKWREDHIRPHVNAFPRWGWAVSCSPTLLGTLLRNAGVRAERTVRVL